LEYEEVQVFQLKERSRHKKNEEKSVEAKTSGIGHGTRKVGRVKIKCALRVL
jgi:hypothetical protein